MNRWLDTITARYVNGRIDLDEFERQCERAIAAEEDFNIIPPADIPAEILTIQQDYQRKVEMAARGMLP